MQSELPEVQQAGGGLIGSCRARWRELTLEFSPSGYVRLEPGAEDGNTTTLEEIMKCQWGPEGQGTVDCASVSKACDARSGPQGNHRELEQVV